MIIPLVENAVLREMRRSLPLDLPDFIDGIPVIYRTLVSKDICTISLHPYSVKEDENFSKVIKERRRIRENFDPTFWIYKEGLNRYGNILIPVFDKHNEIWVDTNISYRCFELILK